MTDLVALLERLVAKRTVNPGGDERALADFLANELQSRAPDAVEVDCEPEGHAWVSARWGTPRLLVNAHIDTVPVNAGWTSDPFTLRRDGGKLTALGAADTKGAIAAVLAAIDEARPKDTLVLFSGDEEVGGSCLHTFLEGGGARGIERAIVCEPTSCRVGTRHRGIVALEASFIGQGGHSSRADHMPAPISEMARLAVAWHTWGERMREVGPPGFLGMCANVAGIDGGVAFNVVPERARLSFSLRPPPGANLAQVIGELTALAQPGVAVRATLANPSFATADLAAFRPLLGAAVESPVDLGFWTEAALFAEAGIDCVVFGPGDIAQAHGADEWVTESDLTKAKDAFISAFQATQTLSR